jgi:micrococcal nuclease
MIHTKTITIMAATAVLLLLLSCGAKAGYSDGSTSLNCPGCPAIPVTEVIDGDTFGSFNKTVRLYGVDTPERGEPCYDEATYRFRELASDSVRVEPGSRRTDSYGRLLYYVYTTDGQSIDEILIQEGLAQAWPEDGQHRNVLLAVEERARENQTGCWKGGVE